MCEIFPEVDTCCAVASIRVGMMLIAILSITTGAISLGVVEQKTNIALDKMLGVYGTVSNITDPLQIVPNLFNIIYSFIVFMSFVFMFADIMCLFATLTDQEGFAQIFVWLVFLNIIIGIILVGTVTIQCTLWQACLLANMDWLSGAIVLLSVTAYLMLWFYFCCVANSYVLEPHV